MPLDPADLERKHKRWIALVTEMHPEFRFTRNADVAFTPLARPLAESTLALVCTAGVHLASQPPYDLRNPHGDWSWREIPSDSAAEDVRFAHVHYDTAGPEADVDCVFPLRSVRRLAARGVIGAVAPRHFGMMGWIPDGAPVQRETAPELARMLKADGVDMVLLTPG